MIQASFQGTIIIITIELRFPETSLKQASNKGMLQLQWQYVFLG